MANNIEINKDLLRLILSERRAVARAQVESLYLRDALTRMPQLHSDLVNTIQGVHRCGKSTLQMLIASHSQFNFQTAYFVNFEDPRLADVLNYKTLAAIVEIAEEENPSSSCLFLFDEIQGVELWEKWFHIEVEKKKHYFSVTGSNASLLEGEFGSSLTGRNKKIELFPFSYKEFISVVGDSSIEKYFSVGGFPRVLKLEEFERLEILRQYFTEILERDVKRQVAARSSVLLAKVAKAVFESTGSETSLKKLAAQFQTSVETCKSYLEAYISAYLVLPCYFYTDSERQRVVRSVKYYPVDLGLHKAITTRTKLDLGKKLETLVYHELRRAYKEVYYWREKHEVDFVIETAEGVRPIQVTWDKPLSRHFDAYNEFKKSHPYCLPLLVVTQHNFEKFALSGLEGLNKS